MAVVNHLTGRRGWSGAARPKKRERGGGGRSECEMRGKMSRLKVRVDDRKVMGRERSAGESGCDFGVILNVFCLGYSAVIKLFFIPIFFFC